MHTRWLITLCLAVSLAACTRKETPSTESTPADQDTAPAETTSGAQVTELKKEDLQEGTGAVAASGKRVTVHYTGRLMNGTKFDSSLDRDEPFTFPLGAGRVIPGWEEGLQGMKVGGKRKLTIPAEMAYGDRGMPPVIPPNAPLVFEVELLKVE